jgi:hypothetical protein
MIGRRQGASSYKGRTRVPQCGDPMESGLGISVLSDWPLSEGL